MKVFLSYNQFSFATHSFLLQVSLLIIFIVHSCIGLPFPQNKDEHKNIKQTEESSLQQREKPKLSDSLIFSPLDTATLWAAQKVTKNVMPVYIRVSVVLSQSLYRKEREKLDITLDSTVFVFRVKEIQSNHIFQSLFKSIGNIWNV